MVNNPAIDDHRKTFKPYYNSSGDDTFYNFTDSKEELKQHAEECDAIMKDRRKNRDRKN